MPSQLFQRRHAVSLFVLIFLTLTGITVFSLVRPGNNLGIDEWAHLYRASQGGLEYANRPLSLLPLVVLTPFLRTNPTAYHVVSISVWVLTAFMVYLNVRLLAPERPIFAMVCGFVFLVYFQDDFWIPLSFLMTADTLTNSLLIHAALAAHFAYMQGDKFTLAQRTSLLVIGAALAVVSVLMREAGVPLLLGLPALIFVAQGKKDRARWVGLVVFCAATFAAALRYLLPILGIGDGTYGSNMLQDFDVIRMARASLVQFTFAVDPFIERASVRPVLLTVAILAGWLIFCLLVLIKFLPEERRQTVKHHAVWIVGSLTAAWLGFSAFLPTTQAENLAHTHVLSKSGEAVLFASVIWLISDGVTHQLGRWGVRSAGVLYVMAAGVAMLWTQQTAIDRMGGTWDATTDFMHSLAEQIPDVRPHTLIIYQQVPDPYETPFTIGVTFQYAMRYFYEDRATGSITGDYTFGTFEVTDEGIRMTEYWIEGEHLYAWDEIIVIGRDANRAVFVAQRLPRDYYTPARQQQYDPYSRIVAGAITQRIRETFGVRR